jgi:adenylate cyclase
MQYHKTSLIINDPRNDKRFPGTDWDPSVKAVLSVPMMTQGRLIGILTLYKKVDDGGFQEADKRLLGIIGAQSAKVVENAQLHDERNHIYQLFGQHTSPAIVAQLLEQGAETTSSRKHVCVMFLDIRNFTTFAEERDPEEVVDYLNTLFKFMIEIISAHHGIVHQLLGDGFMAIFGAPIARGNPSKNAVDAGLAILDGVEKEVQAGNIPATRIGIGLHAGEVVAGTVGSDIHKEYKITGDVVNLAARIEQLTKQYDCKLLASEAVWRELEQGSYQAAQLQNVDVRGRSGTVHLYRLA